MKNMCKAGRRAVFGLVALLVVMVLAIAPASVSAQVATATASRDIAIPTLAPGEATEITVTFTSLLGESKSFALQENIPSGWSLTRGTDDATSFKSSTNEWVWFSVDAGATKVVTYTLTVPADALAADYPISGTVMADGVSNTVGGEVTITVTEAEVFDPYTYDEDEDGEFSRDETLAAVNAYLAGTIGKSDALAVVKLYFG